MMDLADWVLRVVDALGYTGVAMLVALENVFPPIPSEIVLPLAGFAAGNGSASFFGMVTAATVGSVAGAWILYGAAAWFGPVRLRRLVERWGKYFGVDVDDVERTEQWFDRYANRAVLLARCVPLMRSLVSIPAGYRRMNAVKFTVYTAIGSAAWNLALIGAGMILGENWHAVADYLDYFKWLVVAAVLGLLALFVVLRVRRNRRRRLIAEE